MTNCPVSSSSSRTPSSIVSDMEEENPPITFYLASSKLPTPPAKVIGQKDKETDEPKLIWYKCTFCDFQYPDLLRLVDHEQRHQRNNKSDKFPRPSHPAITAVKASENLSLVTSSQGKHLESVRLIKSGTISEQLLRTKLEQVKNLPKQFGYLNSSMMTDEGQLADSSVDLYKNVTAYFSGSTYFTDHCSRLDNIQWSHLTTNVNGVRKKRGKEEELNLDPDTQRYFIVLPLNGQTHFMCRICNKSLLTAVRARRHMFLHTGQRLFNCAECDKSYIYSYGLGRHLKKFHNISP